MLVTINTDASYSYEYKIGTFSFLIVCDEGRFSHTGVLRKKVNTPDQAEMKCILNAFHVLSKQKFQQRINKIIVNTDSLNCIHLLTNNKKAIQKYHLASWGNHLVLTFGIMLSVMKIKGSIVAFRHVPAHKDTDTARTWVNDQLDRQAKEMLWKEINSKK